MENKYIAVLQKTIDKTKNNTLHWHPLDSQKELYKRQTSYIAKFTTVTSLYLPEIIYENSFYALYNNGYLFLITKKNTKNAFISPDDFIISLEIQNGHFSKELLNTNSSEEISISIKRLYNLVEHNCFNLDDFIDDFLNS